ncbi:MAG TPA: hypothetical protein VJ804_07355 [Acidimicrobiales bacterium]|nr:hypothetical protein [Acidimicrobiales bacterium]
MKNLLAGAASFVVTSVMLAPVASAGTPLRIDARAIATPDVLVAQAIAVTSATDAFAVAVAEASGDAFALVAVNSDNPLVAEVIVNPPG